MQEGLVAGPEVAVRDAPGSDCLDTRPARPAHASHPAHRQRADPKMLQRLEMRQSAMDPGRVQRMRMRQEEAQRMLDLALRSRDAHALSAAIRAGKSSRLRPELLEQAQKTLSEWVQQEWEKANFLQRVIAAVTDPGSARTEEELAKLCSEAEQLKGRGLDDNDLLAPLLSRLQA